MGIASNGPVFEDPKLRMALDEGGRATAFVGGANRLSLLAKSLAAQFRSIARNMRAHLEGQNPHHGFESSLARQSTLATASRITFLLIGGIPTSCAQDDVVAYDANRTCR
jgi:hypothetical protein